MGDSMTTAEKLAKHATLRRIEQTLWAFRHAPLEEREPEDNQHVDTLMKKRRQLLRELTD